MRKFNFWILLCMGVIPVAILYQLSWDYYLKSLPLQFWIGGASSQLLLLKSASELVMYSIMFWFLICGTKTSFNKIKAMVCTLLGCIILYTGYSLVTLN
ncbi:hypothetical protein [Paraglaciecola sp.]|uniref:hypothetical protein n=1 Tax=Paraglaciecola sp. TaxID=1920173 RepID=UPI0032660A63